MGYWENFEKIHYIDAVIYCGLDYYILWGFLGKIMIIKTRKGF